MSTRSTIVIQNKNGTFSSIYCHWDGYPEYVGAILLKYYNTERRARQLIKLGDISVLRPSIGKKHDFENWELADSKGWTTAYGRDRGEENVGPSTSDILCDVPREAYIYVWQDGQWWWGCRHNKREHMETLTEYFDHPSRKGDLDKI